MALENEFKQKQSSLLVAIEKKYGKNFGAKSDEEVEEVLDYYREMGWSSMEKLINYERNDEQS
jgi:hypothetical protein